MAANITPARLEAACLGIVLVIAAGLRLWGLEANGFGTEYYAAGVRSAVSGKPVPQAIVSTFSRALQRPGAGKTLWRMRRNARFLRGVWPRPSGLHAVWLRQSCSISRVVFGCQSQHSPSADQLGNSVKHGPSHNKRHGKDVADQLDHPHHSSSGSSLPSSVMTGRVAIR